MYQLRDMAAVWLIQVLYLSQLNNSLDSGLLVDQQTVLTNTTYGTLRGVAGVSAEGTVLSYLGVPYAKPPTGSRRFKRPEKPDPWSGERDAGKLGSMCPQYRATNDHSGMSEDCLTLNIYTPVRSTGQLPVMVWVHGGSFRTGSGTIFNGTELAYKGVVVVTINYRLDILGFMSTEDDSAPGNFGLLDQILALEWVKENIGSFGGDPNQVTIFGESAGAACVSLLILSPLAGGLFQKAIVESGSSIAPWAVSYPTNRLTPKLIAGQVGGKVNCQNNISTQFVDCMRNVDAFVLLGASDEFRRSIHLDVSFTPVVESIFKVVPDRPLKILTAEPFNHVDTIRGYNTDEALFVLGQTSGMTREQFRQKLSSVIMPFNIADINQTLNDFESLYLGNITDPDLIVRQALTALSDYAFIAPTILESKLATKAAPEKNNFLYEFRYRRSVSTSPAWVQAVHADEVPFVFDAFNNPGLWPVSSGHTPDDDMIAQEITTIWTNFAKSRSPLSLAANSLTWRPLSDTNDQLLKIDTVSSLITSTKQPAVDLFERILKLIDNSQITTSVVG
ncbi:Neuroligin-4, X-linked [Bulinus truncatus]|nr:Neuroligin-4, X-linked [Bulinus truncatus]